MENKYTNKTGRCLGIDWGSARIGLALGDMETKIASPLGVVSSINEIINIIQKEGIELIVLGHPQSIVDQNFPSSKEYNSFVDLLKKMTNTPIEIIDERLSSKAADALSGDKKTKASRDALAAMIILQSYLDKR